MRTFLLITLSLFCTVLSLRAELINGVYVIVNDDVITYQEVEQSIAPVADLLAKQYRDQPRVFEQRLQQARSERVNELIERHLVLHEFETGGYQLPESIIDDIIRERIKEKYIDRATLTKTLQAQGMTFEGFRKQVREDYIFRAMVSQKMSQEKVLISPYKIENYYNENQDKFKVTDQVKLRTIDLKKPKENPEIARKLAQEILSKLKEGASFADMASIYSDSNKDKGGDRGWVDRNLLRKELSDVAFSLQPGKHSEVIDLEDACYLIYAEEVRTAHTRPLADVRDEIEKELKAQEQARLKEQWISRLKNKSFIRYF